MPAAKKRSRESASTAQPAPAQPVSGVVALQSCSATLWEPSAVAAIEACPDGSVLAVARDNGSIEFWDTDSWRCAKVVPGKQDAAINSLTWVYDTVSECWRFFSGGLDGNVVEWDLDTLRPSHVSSSLGGAAWAVSADPNQQHPHRPHVNDGLAFRNAEDSDAGEVLVAVATDDGAVRLLVAEGGGKGLQYRRLLGRAESRALCVAWNADSSIVYAGYADGCIRGHLVSAGQEVIRITAGMAAGAADPECCIWSIAVLPDGCIVSGSARGIVQVWESQFGTLLSSAHQHQADVTVVAASRSGDRIFAAGVDPSIVLLTRADGAAPALGSTAAPAAEGGPSRFTYSDRKRPHTHDVRAMAVVHPSTSTGSGGFLVTGGNDAQLLVHMVEMFGRRHPVRVCSAPCAPLLAFAAAAQPPRFAAASELTVELWAAAAVQVASGAGKQQKEEGDACSIEKSPSKLAAISLPGPHHIQHLAISPCGNFLAVATVSELRLLMVITDQIKESGRGDEKGRGSVERAVRVVNLALPKGLGSCSALAFGVPQPTSAGPRCLLFCAALDGCLCEVELGDSDSEAGTLTALHTASRVDRRDAFADIRLSACDQLQPLYTHLVCSVCGSSLVAASPTSVHVFNLNAGKQTKALKGELPLSTATSSPGAVTAVALSADGSVVAVATTECKLQLFHTATLLPLAWLQQHASVPLKLDAMGGHVLSITFRPGVAGDATSLVVCTHAALCHFSLAALKVGKEVSGTGVEKKYRIKGRPRLISDGVGEAIRLLPSSPTLCFGACFALNESLLVVHGDWSEAVRMLPAPLLLRHYGA